MFSRRDRDGLMVALRDVELLPLMAALAHHTGDRRLIPGHLSPSVFKDPQPIPLPQGGLSAAQQAEARALLADKLMLFDGSPIGPAPGPSGDALTELIQFLAGKLDNRMLDFLVREFDPSLFASRPDTALTQDCGDGVKDDLFTLIVGAGVSGIGVAARLKDAGVPFLVVEKNREIGGTWFENTYPGCRLDTSNYAYGYSIVQPPEWPHQYSTRQDIQDYLYDVVESFGLREFIVLGTTVTDAVFEPDSASWLVTVQSGAGRRTLRARFLVYSVGQLNIPKYPDIEGSQSFAGCAMHSARWNSDVELRGRRVALIGTGASAYQVGPSIIDDVVELHVVQRSAPWALPTPQYQARIPEAMAALLTEVPAYGRWLRFWQFINSVEGRLPYVRVDPSWNCPGSVSQLNQIYRDRLTQHLVEQYQDRPDLLNSVVPTYPPGAKRMLRDDGSWHRMLTRKQTRLHTKPIDRIVQNGLIVDGELIEADVIIYCTGFDASNMLSQIPTVGLGGMELNHYWEGDPRANLGITVPEFPNMFLLYGPNTNLVVNGSATFMAECASTYVVDAIRTLAASGARWLNCRTQALTAFVDEMDRENALRAWGVPQVNSWYKSRTGRVSQIWPHDLFAYWDRTKSIDLDDYRLE